MPSCNPPKIPTHIFKQKSNPTHIFKNFLLSLMQIFSAKIFLPVTPYPPPLYNGSPPSGGREVASSSLVTPTKSKSHKTKQLGLWLFSVFRGWRARNGG